MSKPKSCPFCGKEPAKSFTGYLRCPIPGTGAHTNGMTPEEWAHRPIEDALQQRIDELEKTEKWLRGLLKKSQDTGKTLRQSVREAAKEIAKESVRLSDNYFYPAASSYARALVILRKHGLLED